MQPTVWSRVLRGYGPLVLLAALLILVAIVVPSKPQNKVQAASNYDAYGNGSGGSTGAGAGTGPSGASGDSGGVLGASGTSGGGSGGGSAAGAGSTGGGPAGTNACGDRRDQVTNDPYSPPCIAFSGNNGGSTSRGVSATQIDVAYRVLNEQGFQQTLATLAGGHLLDSNADVQRTIDALVEYFNKHFQFYGRKLKIDYYNGVGSNTTELLGGGVGPAQADATTVASQLKAFADVSATSEPYADALSRQGVVGLGDPYMSAQWHRQHGPYIWSIAVDGTKVSDEAAFYFNKRLAGGKAAYAGGAIRNSQRKVASFAPENSWYQESVDNARAIISKAGNDPGPNYKYQLDLNTMSSQAANLVPRMQTDGVTTILCGCDPVMMVFMTGAMSRAHYYPEIINTGVALDDFDVVGQLWAQDVASHVLGISPNEAPVPSTQTIGYKAYKSVRNDEPAFVVDLVYDQLYELAIGIQMAGPHLDANTFQQGMFHYPAKLGPNGLWGFGPDDYTTADDFREICYDPNAISDYNNHKGAYIDPHPGQRYTFETLPSGPPSCPVPPA